MTRKPRILIVTPEITALPPGMDNRANSIVAKAGGMADVTAGIVTALFELGADVHVAIPNYRQLFNVDVNRLQNRQLLDYKARMPDARVHLAEDSIFYYRRSVYRANDNLKAALRFQREVINNIIPAVNPDLIHCNDWMTGLIPAMARRLGIPCLTTIHNIHTWECTLGDMEENGLDPAEFWQYLFYTSMPGNYEHTHQHCRVDLAASGIFASHFMNTVSEHFLQEIVDDWHDFIPYNVRREVKNKYYNDCAAGILNAPPSEYDPATDDLLPVCYSDTDHESGKAQNKRILQKELHLLEEPDAPIFFWPSRLDPVQKGSELLTHVLYQIVSSHWDSHLQLVVVADGPDQQALHNIVNHHGFNERVAVRNFDERLSHLAFAASDFVLMPSRFEPCGLPQMIGATYGTLPLVHDTGGLHDTVEDLMDNPGSGNGFVFKTYDCGGLLWAIDQAMTFHSWSPELKRTEISRIMRSAKTRFSHRASAEKYFALYERMLERPLIDPISGETKQHALRTA